MKILCVGDVVGEAGLQFAGDILPTLKREHAADFVIVNGENSDKSGTGLTRHGAQALLQYADVITTGNHCFRRADETLYLENETVLCPANYPGLDASAGCCVVDTGRLGSVCVINMAGVAWLEPIDNPFNRIDKLLQSHPAKYTIVDFHAESTAEKKAFGFYVDGRVSAVFGTHTHVQTADEQILPQGTGYITDVGMTGPYIGVLGVAPEGAVQKQKNHRPTQFHVAEGPCMLNAALFTLDDATGRCVTVQRIDKRLHK